MKSLSISIDSNYNDRKELYEVCLWENTWVPLHTTQEDDCVGSDGKET